MTLKKKIEIKTAFDTKIHSHLNKFISLWKYLILVIKCEWK